MTMIAGTARGMMNERLGTVITAIALVLSVFAAFKLVSGDIRAAKHLRSLQQFATEVPPSGTLGGYSMTDDTEWMARHGSDSELVLFSVAVTGEVGDLDFWREVALRSRKAVPNARFVGLCVAGRTCGSPRSEVEGLTLLTSMDPSQMRGLAMAASQGKAIVYRDLQFQGMLPIKGEKSAFVLEIVRRLGLPGGAVGS